MDSIKHKSKGGTQPQLVSVVMCVRNGVEFVGLAIESILTQTHQHIELIVIDDGSRDSTLDVLGEYERSDSRMIVRSQPPLGIVAGSQLGCGIASGRFIARLDADDISMPSRLERQVDFLIENPHIGLVGTAARFITHTGALTNWVQRPPTRDSEIKKLLRKHNCLIHSSILMRADVFRAVGGYRVPFVVAQDYDLWIRISNYSTLANLDEVLTHYRLHACQVSARGLERQSVASLAIVRAAAIKNNSGLDPFDGAVAIDRELLSRLGITDLEIETHLFHAYIGRLHLMRSLGLGAEVNSLLQQTFSNEEEIRALLSKIAPAAEVTEWERGADSALR